jgi:hypothetical protein
LPFGIVLGVWKFSVMLPNVCFDQLNVFRLCKCYMHVICFCICICLCLSLKINKLQKKLYLNAVFFNINLKYIYKKKCNAFFFLLYSRSMGGVYLYTHSTGGWVYSVRPSIRPSLRLSKIFFVAFFSATIDGRNLIFGHKLHIGKPYCGKRFWIRQIPTSCLPK